MLFKSKIEMHITKNDENVCVDAIADFIANRYRVKVVEIFGYGDDKNYDFKIEGSMRRIVKLLKECVSGECEYGFDAY